MWNFKKWIAVSLLALALVRIGTLPAADQVTVVTTVPDLKALTEAVGGKHVLVNCISAGNQDPHQVPAKPSYMMLAKHADLWIRIGMELEIGYESLILDGSRNDKIKVGTPGHLDASEGVLRLDVPTGKVDRSMGDIHPLGNPHYLQDPWNARVVSAAIAERLKKLNPENAADYEANAKAFRQSLDEKMFGKDLLSQSDGETLWKWELDGKLDANLKDKGLTAKLSGWLGTLKKYQGTKIFTYHRSWVYFENRFGLVDAGQMEPKPGLPPSPAHLAEMIDVAKKENVKLILVEPFFDKKGPDFVVAHTSAKVLELANAVGGQKEMTDYFSMMDTMVNKVSAALGETKP